MTPTTSPHILLSAYQCGPGMGSVSQIGWEWYARLACRAPTTLVTHIRNREPLTKAGAPLPYSEVVFVDTEWFAGPLYRLASRIFPRSQHAVFLISSLDFFAYDRSAETLLRRRMACGESWNIVHAVTPVSPAAPTRLHRLGLPLIIGPLNGGLGTPRLSRDHARGVSLAEPHPQHRAPDRCRGWLNPARHGDPDRNPRYTCEHTTTVSFAVHFHAGKRCGSQCVLTVPVASCPFHDSSTQNSVRRPATPV